MRLVPAVLLTTIATITAAAGCSSKDDPAASSPSATRGAPGWVAIPGVSGTRLRANFVTGGGARELVSFRDTRRSEDCTFQPAEGGRTRCLPKSIVAAESGSFADASCTTPLAALTSPCSGDATVAISYRYDQGSCAQTVDTIRAVLPASSSRYVQGPTGCIAQAGAPPVGAAFVPLGEVIPWTDYVEGVATVIPGDPVAEKVLVAPDGARQHLGFRIESLDVDCTFQVMKDGSLLCIPDANTGGVTYADDACTKPLFVDDYASGGVCEPRPGSKLWIEPTLDACGGARTVFSLRASTGGDVAPYNDALYSRRMTSTGSEPPVEQCSSTGSGSFGTPSSRRAIEADITSTLPTAARINAGNGRLVPALVSLPGGAALALGWHDTERDSDCTFARASDGKLRCLPTGAQATLLHTDDACKSAGVVAVLDKVPCTGPPRFARVATSACAPTSRVFELGTQKRDLTIASVGTAPGHCPILQGVTNALDATEVDPAGFVEGAPVTE